jgi:hypothetical protein
VTTFEPGASDVFTHGRVRSPFATAFCARRPAASITLGLLVFVQLVIAAITTAPCCRRNFSPLCSQGIPVSSVWTGASPSITATAFSVGWADVAPDICAANASAYIFFDAESGMRSCGRFGPARLGTTVERSSSSVSEKTGSGVESVRKSPCALV